MSECVHECVHVHICVGAQEGQRTASDPLELKIEEVVSHLIWYYDSNPSPLEVLLIAELLSLVEVELLHKSKCFLS